MISVNRIKFANYSSLDFDLITELAFDSDNGTTGAFLGREAVASETYRGAQKKVHNYRWNEALSPTFTFLKEGFGDFSLDEQRKILKWLTSKDTPSYLTIYHDDSSVISYEILGNWISIDTYKLGNGRVVGFVAQFESVSPWAYSPLNTITKDVSNPANNTITFNIKTDDLQSAVYPRITITQKNSKIVQVGSELTDDNVLLEDVIYQYGNQYYWHGFAPSSGYSANNKYYTYNSTLNKFIEIKIKDATEYGEITETIYEYSKFNSSSTQPTYIDTTGVKITNVHDGNDYDFTLINNRTNEVIVVDGANKVISTSVPNRVFGDDFSWKWLPLFEGENKITVVGNCEVTLEWRTVVKCGEF